MSIGKEEIEKLFVNLFVGCQIIETEEVRKRKKCYIKLLHTHTNDIFLMMLLPLSVIMIFSSLSKVIPYGQLNKALPHSPSALPGQLPAIVVTTPAYNYH